MGGKGVWHASLPVALACLLAAQVIAQAPAGRRAAAPAPARTEKPVPFRAGETLSYDVSWSNVVTAGTATVSVREKRPAQGSLAYHIVAEGEPTPLLAKLYTLHYKVETLLDAYTLLPQLGTVDSLEGTRRRLKTTRFDQAARKALYEVRTATVVTRELVIPAHTQDALSAIYVLRALPLRQGAKLTLPVSDSGATYQVEVTVVGREQVRAGVGTVSAWRLSPVIQGTQDEPASQRALALWITDDERRLPVRLQAELAVGSFVLTLRDAGE